MSFRYVIHLDSGQKIRSGCIDDVQFEDIAYQLIDFMKIPAGCYAFKPDQKDTEVFQLIVGRENVSHISFLEVK